ncbi:chaperone protein dnaJ 8 chloroplastic [Prunus yedoensis var. nudiflora]|uniref:Chaperone protein dnaJ 8 chloroplastic n=1 Tax=Prunus yedoensis var. nudiflora TaxID=2094558 RepID=A0A314ZEP5_PRUYE|nr:chaperone protein dnaJ 8 chloroplastic [Prunus yedoensis var. nudiflora]
MAAVAAGVIGGNASSWNLFKDKPRKKKTVNRVMVSCVYSSVMDPYRTLKIQPGASESEVRKAFRQLALKGISSVDNCQFTDCYEQFERRIYSISDV